MTGRSIKLDRTRAVHYCSCGRSVVGNARAQHQASHARRGDAHRWIPIEEWRGLRIPLVQTEEWDRRRDATHLGPYQEDRCCMCFRPVGADPVRLTITRTNDGGWWIVHPSAPVRDDERHMGNPHFVLPIGQECLRKHPELLLGRVLP